MTTTGVARNTVMAFLRHLNEENFAAARKCADDDLKFDGVMGSRDGADAYFADMEKMKFKYEIKKAFRNGNHVCLLYDINMDGITIFTCGWYHIKNNKIKTIKVVFDPRPLLEKTGKQ